MSAPLLRYSALIIEYHTPFFGICQAGIAFCILKSFVNYVQQSKLQAANNILQQFPAAAALSGRRAVDQNAVLPDHLYVAPVDNAVVLPSQQSEEPRSAVNDNGYQLGVAGVHFHIADIAQPHTVLDIDNLFVSQIHDTTIHNNPPGSAR